MEYNQIKSHAKVNLALNITGRSSKLHNIESIVTFIELHDLIFIRRLQNKKHSIFFYGKFSKGINKNNTVSKLLKILDEKKMLNGKKFQIRIKKNIPQQSGLGGGSMNAANILSFFVKKKVIKINKKKILEVSKLVGSDVILGIRQINTILTSKKIIKRFSNTQKYHTLLVRPNFGCSTKIIYAKVKNFTKPKFIFPTKIMFQANNLINSNNALEKIVFLKYPKLKIIKSFLNNLAGSLFARMSGSGSVIVAYFRSKKLSEKAKVKFRRKFKNYWCVTSKTI
jgi:4-diphosphocytidyl-2-C-methyl-D-erythritol kinase